MNLIAKAITAFLTSLVGILTVFKVNVPDALTPELIGQFVLAAATIAGLVWGVPNKDATGQNVIRERGSVLLIAIMGLSLLLGGCVTPRPPVNSISDAIVVTASDIETAAVQIREMCGNTVPDGPCAAGALIDTDLKGRMKTSLQSGLDAVKLANRSLAANNAAQAGSSLDRAEAILRVIQAELARRSNE